MEEAAAVGVGIADAHEIDELNIYEASKAAMLKAVKRWTSHRIIF